LGGEARGTNAINHRLTRESAKGVVGEKLGSRRGVRRKGFSFKNRHTLEIASGLPCSSLVGLAERSARLVAEGEGEGKVDEA